MTNPFDNEEGLFHVLRNDAGEFSLWPAHLTVPAGWETALTAVSSDAADQWVRDAWTGLTLR